MTKTRQAVEKEIDVLTAERRGLLDAEEKATRDAKAERHKRERAHLETLRQHYTDAEEIRQACLLELFKASRAWDADPGHNVRIRFGDAHLWSAGGGLRFEPISEAEKALLGPMNQAVVLFEV